MSTCMFAGSCRIVAPFSSLGTCSLLDTRWHAEHASQFMRYGRRHRRHAAGFARTKTDPIGLLRWTGRLTSWGTTWSLPCLASLAPWTMSLLTLQRCASRDREPLFQELSSRVVDLTGVIVSVSGSALAPAITVPFASMERRPDQSRS